MELNKGRRGIPLSYLFLAALGFPLKWAKMHEVSVWSG